MSGCNLFSLAFVLSAVLVAVVDGRCVLSNAYPEDLGLGADDGIGLQMSIFALEEVVAVGSSTAITDCAAFCDGKRWCLATAADGGGDDGACRFYTDKTRLGLAAAGDDLCSASVNFGCRLSTGKRDGILLDLDGHVFQVATEGLGSHDDDPYEASMLDRDDSGACRVSTADDKYRPDDFGTLELHTRYFAGAPGSVDVWAEKMEAAHDGHEDVRRRLNEHVEVGFFDHAVSASLGAGYPITAARKAVREFTTEDWYDRRHDPLHKRIAQAFYRFRYNTWHGQCLPASQRLSDDGATILVPRELVTDDRFFYITTTMNSELRYLN